MTVIDEVLAQPTGARFFRADLHIHSYGGSHDVSDVSMTPEAIVQTAKTEGLALISITDHNEITGVEAALRAAKGSSVLVVPGVELSTSDGHLLCYLPTLETLQRFHASLAIVDRGTQNSRCQTAILECLNQLKSYGGFGILAHVDIKSGFETEVPGASPHKIDVISHAALLGIELKQPSSPISYAEGDPDGDRVKIGKTRIDRLQLGSKQHLARVQNSDARDASSSSGTGTSPDGSSVSALRPAVARCVTIPSPQGLLRADDGSRGRAPRRARRRRRAQAHRSVEATRLRRPVTRESSLRASRRGCARSASCSR